MAFRTANTPKPAVNQSTGQAWTEEEKAAYHQQQEAAFKNLMVHFRGKGPKSRISFPAKVLEFSAEPFLKTETFNGVQQKRMVSTVKVELTQPGCEGIRFIMDVTDNPRTIQNSGSALNHLYVAAMHQQVPEFGAFAWDSDDLIGKEVFAVIQKGGPRSDGNRGGFWSELKDFEEMVPEEAEAPAPEPARKAPAKAAKKAAAPDPEVPADEDDTDDVPF